MDTAGIIALVACAASICARIVFLIRERNLERVLEHESQVFDKTKTDLFLARKRRKNLAQEKKQFAAHATKLNQNIEYMETTLEELLERKREEDEVLENQREILHGKKKR